MSAKRTRVAIAYDFDGTLAKGNMQEHSFIPGLGLTPDKFWPEVKELAHKHDMDEILTYMELMIRTATEKGFPIRKQEFQRHGRAVSLFPGVEHWFDRINSYGKEKGLIVEHYIISSGLREMISATSIGKKFRYIFASGYMYDANEVAKWPALAVNYTTKTQYLFRINKGILNSYDNGSINKFTPTSERPIPFSNMIYIGDGETDVPCMKMLKYQGGHTIAVYEPWEGRATKKQISKRQLCYELLEQNRADYAAPADYTEDKILDGLVKNLLDKISTESSLLKLKHS